MVGLFLGFLPSSVAMGNGPGIEDVFRIGNGDIPASYVSLPEGNYSGDFWQKGLDP